MLKITNYSSSNPRKYGVYFYDRHIIRVIDEVNSGVKSYLFKLVIQSKNSESIKYKNIEPITFIKTLDLKDLPRKTVIFRKELVEKFEIDSKKEIDWETYLQTSHKELYDYHIERANRKLAAVIPFKKEIEVKWIDDNPLEFLEFTNNYAFGFELEGKYGAAAKISNHQKLGYSNYSFDLAPLEEVWSHYDLPYGFTYKSTEDKIADFRAFSLNIQLRLAKKYINSIKNSEEYLPYHVYLAGTDDFSYSKYFCTLKEAEQEMNYLRMMQPLDFKLDILDRGYLFTN